MDFRECEIFDLGTANKNGGKSSSSDCKDGIDHARRGAVRNAGTSAEAMSAVERDVLAGSSLSVLCANAAMVQEVQSLFKLRPVATPRLVPILTQRRPLCYASPVLFTRP